MAAMKETPVESSRKTDLHAVQQLVFSVGHLKLSLRSLSSLHLQSALLSQKESESSECHGPLESNRILENIVSDMSANKPNIDESNGACLGEESQKSISVEDLELIQRRLKEELERKRLEFITSFAEKCKNNETFLKYL